MFWVARIRIAVGIYMQWPPEATPAIHRGAPSQHLAGTLPAPCQDTPGTFALILKPS